MLPPLHGLARASDANRKVLTFVVMPCLNEAVLIARTLASLGFSANKEAPPDTHLVVVDNGSSDGTIEILQQIRSDASAPVHILSEPLRGYVPPRRKGVEAAEALSQTIGADPSSVLILQADADTSYQSGYVAAMQLAVAPHAGIILEGATRHPFGFNEVHQKYIAAERLVDDVTESFDAEDEHEVVVDDKVCGYRLSDYLLWGGLFEEMTAAGDHIHAETTRMYIRAKLRHGTRKIRINAAGAASSRRKVFENPWLHYSTVGFPREEKWVREWITKRSDDRRASDVDQFAMLALDGKEPDAVFLRRAHQLALFRYLPALVRSAAGNTTSMPPEDVAAVLAALPPKSLEDFSQAPGQAIFELLTLIDTYPKLFS